MDLSIVYFILLMFFCVAMVWVCWYVVYRQTVIKKKIDKDTKENGNYYFGRIVKIEVISHDPETDINTYSAEVYFYCREEMRTRSVTENCGYNKFEYPIGSYVKIKYYNDDINFDEDSLNVTQMPENIKAFLKEKTDNIKEEELKRKPNFY